MEDVVTQAELDNLSNLQSYAYDAQMACSKLALQIEDRLKRGAKIETGNLHWDKRRRMARTGYAKQA